MKRLIADIHMHTLASGHAYGTIREMAAAAKEQQLQLIGISEHAPGIPGTVDPFYYGNLRVIPRVIDGVEILHGCEINVLNGMEFEAPSQEEKKYIDRLDYAIVGIHGLCYQNEGTDGNTTNLIECMKNPKVKLVSHPDDDHTPLDYPRLVQAALQYHVALEVNNSSLVKKDQRLPELPHHAGPVPAIPGAYCCGLGRARPQLGGPAGPGLCAAGERGL